VASSLALTLSLTLRLCQSILPPTPSSSQSIVPFGTSSLTKDAQSFSIARRRRAVRRLWVRRRMGRCLVVIFLRSALVERLRIAVPLRVVVAQCASSSAWRRCESRVGNGSVSARRESRDYPCQFTEEGPISQLRCIRLTASWRRKDPQNACRTTNAVVGSVTTQSRRSKGGRKNLPPRIHVRTYSSRLILQTN
jgi:hypothetical protein